MTAPTAATERPQRLRNFIDRLERWLWGGPDGELGRLSERDLQLIAQDIGLSMHELERLTRSQNDGHLLYQRLAQLRLDGATLKEQGYLRDLERTCALCTNQGMCQHDLGERPDSSDWERYCPNVETLKSLAPSATSDKREG